MNKKSRTAIQEFRKNSLLYLPPITIGPGLAKTGYNLSIMNGDDAHLKIGLPQSGARFTLLEEGLVIDNVTGLMWPSNPGLCEPTIGVAGVQQYLNWENAINACEALVYAGFSDWRIPNIRELVSLIDLGEEEGALNLNYFPIVWVKYYWSGTTSIEDTVEAWAIEYVYGYTYPINKATTRLVLPVRGGHINA